MSQHLIDMFCDVFGSYKVTVLIADRNGLGQNLKQRQNSASCVITQHRLRYNGLGSFAETGSETERKTCCAL